jgi:hypothetical protein
VQACGFEILYDIKRKSKGDEAAATAVHDVKVPRALTFDHLTIRAKDYLIICRRRHTTLKRTENGRPSFIRWRDLVTSRYLLTHFIEAPVR